MINFSFLFHIILSRIQTIQLLIDVYLIIIGCTEFHSMNLYNQHGHLNQFNNSSFKSSTESIERHVPRPVYGTP